MSGWIKSNAALVTVIALLLFGGTGLLATNYFRKSTPRVMDVSDQRNQLEEPPPRPLRYAPGEIIPARGYSVKKGAQDFPGGMGYLDTDAWLKYTNVDFGTNAAKFMASVAVPAENAGKDIVVHLDDPQGPEIARLTVKSTGGWGNLQMQEAPLSSVTGLHNVFLTFTGSGVANLYWIRFVPLTPTLGVGANGAGIAVPPGLPSTQPTTRPTVGLNGFGADAESPATQPTTQPATRPTTQPN